MRKIIALCVLFLILSPLTFAEEEVVLDVDAGFTLSDSENDTVENVSTNEKKSELTLYEKIQNIKHLEIEDTNQIHYLLDDITTLKPQHGFVESIHPFFGYRGNLSVNIQSDDTDVTKDFSMLDAGIDGKFRGSETYYEARLRMAPQHNYSFLQFLPSNMYIANKSIPHHTILVGNSRTPTGVEGGMSAMLHPFVARSQISRTIGNVRKVGVRVKGDYPLIEYDLGGYSSDVCFKSFFPGAEFTGWANLKPLGKTKGKYGSLKIGGGISAGRNNTNYFISGAYVGYEYKKFFADFEWSNANGYNSTVDTTTKHASGFYTTAGYKVTPKLHALIRYDQFNPDNKISHNTKREYSAGLNYFIKGQSLRLMLNYVFCQNDKTKDSHRILIGTQILL